jgi:hypothetical protein
VQGAATNEARFDHNPTTGESLGLLVEEARTNLLVRSEEFDNASWTKSSASVTANSISAPSGAATADTLIEDTATNTHLVQASGISVTNGTAYTLSCYAKPAGRNFVQLLLAGGFVSSVQAFVDLTNGTVGATAGSPVVTVTSLVNGWYRVSITATATSTTTTTVQIRVASNSTSGFYQGDGTSGIYLWGAQLEAGAFPTSYIPTTTATVTRAADVASITGSAFSSWYRQDEGTVFVDANSPTAGIHVTFDDNTINTNRVVLYYQSATDPRLFVASAGATSCNINAGAITSNSRALMVGAYKLNDFAASVNGLTPVLDALGNAPTGVDRARLGRSSADAAYLNGCLRRIVFWPTRLPNSTLQTLTT